jgi:hypothetical protein
LTPEAAQALTARANTAGHTVMFAPFTQEAGPFGQVARGEISLAAIHRDLVGGVFTPVSDDRPFFFELSGALPRQLVVTWLAVGAVVLATAVGLLLLARSPSARLPLGERPAPRLIYFALLGVAFMLVELATLARLTLFLGHPTLTVTAVLGVLLLAGGAGSLLSGRVGRDQLGRLIVVAGVAVAVLAVVVPIAIEQAPVGVVSFPVVGRVAYAVLLLAPLGLAMGMLFPSGLRLSSVDATLPWAVNGVASVVGAVLATTLALRFGYPVATIAGAGLYGGLAIVGPALAGSRVRGRHQLLRGVRSAGKPPTGAASASLHD